MLWFSLKRSWKFFWQRKSRGWDDSDLWELDNNITDFILPRLKEFRKKIGSPPTGEMTLEEWKDILNKMIIAFELNDNDETEWTEEEQKKYKEGMFLFAEYFQELWY